MRTKCLHGFLARLPVNVKSSKVYVSFWTFYKTRETFITVCLIFNITYCMLQHDNTVCTAFTSNILGIFTGSFGCEITGSTFMYLGNYADASNFARKSSHSAPAVLSFLFLQLTCFTLFQYEYCLFLVLIVSRTCVKSL